jgi:hypothetical protein
MSISMRYTEAIIKSGHGSETEKLDDVPVNAVIFPVMDLESPKYTIR